MKIKLNNKNKSYNVLKIKEMFGISENTFKVIEFPNNLNRLKFANITFITGPSGSGKTLLANHLKKNLNYIENDKNFNKKIPIIDALDGSFKQNLFHLNMVGLSETFLYLTPYIYLSEGQKFRFELAYILSKNKDYLLIDEFCSLLDRGTAKIISYSLQKIIRNFNKHVVVISSHDDITEFLAPDAIIKFDEYFKSELQVFSKIKTYNISQMFKVKKGNYDEYKMLEKFHYFGNVSYNTLKRRDAKYYSLYKDKDLVGILVTSSPYPGSENELENDFIEINNNIRIIFRLILHPKVRGIGVTKILYNFIIKNENFIIFLRSALAKKYPFPKKLNMIKKNYDNITPFKEYQMMLNMKKQSLKKCFDYGRYILAKMMYRDFSKYNKLIDHNINKDRNISFFHKVVKTTFPETTDLELLEDVIKPIEMEDYYYDNRKFNTN